MENPLQNLGELSSKGDQRDINIKINTPRRVIHCSDGIIEEFDDESDQPKTVDTEVVDTNSLSWIPWMKHYAWTGGNKAIEYCDYLGEGLASFLGITTPKYQLEISEYERQQEAKKKLDEELAGWKTTGESSLVLNQPKTSIQQASENVEQ